MSPIFDWEIPALKTPNKTRRSSRSRLPAFRLWEHGGKLVIDQFSADTLLRLGCSDPMLQAEPGLDRWVAHHKLHSLLKPDGMRAIVRHDEQTACTTLFYHHHKAQIPLTMKRDMPQPPKNAWDPDRGLNLPLARPYSIDFDLFREQVDWARRFLGPRNPWGLKIDSNQIGRIECRGMGLAYQAMRGWPSMTLLSHHLDLLAQLLKQDYQPQSETKKKAAQQDEAVVIQRHDFGPQQTAYWVFRRQCTPSFLAVRCHDEAVQPHEATPAKNDTTLLVFAVRSFISDYMRLIARVAERTVELSVRSVGIDSFELLIGTPNIDTGICFRVPLQAGLTVKPFERLVLSQGRFTRALSLADSPSGHVELGLDRSKTTLSVASVPSPGCDGGGDPLGRAVAFDIHRFQQ